MQKTIDGLKERDVSKVRAPTDQLVKYMCEISLKDLEITQLKEQNQLLQDELANNKSDVYNTQEMNKLYDRITKVKGEN